MLKILKTSHSDNALTLNTGVFRIEGSFREDAFKLMRNGAFQASIC